MTHCHARGIVHGNITLEHLLVKDRDTLLLTGFSCANEHSPSHLVQTLQESPHFASPEVISGVRFQGALPESIDSWNLGIVLYAMLCGRLPFIHKQMQQLCAMIMASPFAEPSHLSADARQLLRSLLQKLPTLRVSATHSRHAAWLEGCCPSVSDTAGSPRKTVACEAVHTEMESLGYRRTTSAEETKPFSSHTARIFFLLRQRHLREGGSSQVVPQRRRRSFADAQVPSCVPEDAVVPGESRCEARKRKSPFRRCSVDEPAARVPEAGVTEALQDVGVLDLVEGGAQRRPNSPLLRPTLAHSTQPTPLEDKSDGARASYFATSVSMTLSAKSKADVGEKADGALEWVIASAPAPASPSHVHKKARMARAPGAVREEELQSAVPDDRSLP